MRAQLGMAAALVLFGCGPGGDDEPRQGQACTLIACLQGLNVTLTSVPTSTPPSSVEAVADGKTVTGTMLCTIPAIFPPPATQTCNTYFAGFSPTRVVVNVAVGAATIHYDVMPNYVVTQPNGPNCGDCRNATVTLSGSPTATSVYKPTGSVQCTGGGLTLDQLKAQLTGGSIPVESAACGFDGNAHITVCGASDGRIGVFEISNADIAAAQALGFAPLSALPDATRAACP